MDEHDLLARTLSINHDNDGTMFNSLNKRRSPLEDVTNDTGEDPPPLMSDNESTTTDPFSIGLPSSCMSTSLPDTSHTSVMDADQATREYIKSNYAAFLRHTTKLNAAPLVNLTRAQEEVETKRDVLKDGESKVAYNAREAQDLIQVLDTARRALELA
ncbi:MAG: hypothetical protein Q9164_002192 [Protoblastenia rupestris]